MDDRSRINQYENNPLDFTEIDSPTQSLLKSVATNPLHMHELVKAVDGFKARVFHRHDHHGEYRAHDWGELPETGGTVHIVEPGSSGMAKGTFNIPKRRGRR